MCSLLTICDQKIKPEPLSKQKLLAPDIHRVQTKKYSEIQANQAQAALKSRADTALLFADSSRHANVFLTKQCAHAHDLASFVEAKKVDRRNRGLAALVFKTDGERKCRFVHRRAHFTV